MVKQKGSMTHGAYPSMSACPPLLAYSASVLAAERMLSFATLAPMPQLQSSTLASAHRIQFHKKNIDCKADLCNKKLLPPLARNATAISIEATMLVSWLRSNNLWCMWTESMLIAIAFAHSIHVTECTRRERCKLYNTTV